MAFKDALKPKAGSKHLSTIINAEGQSVQAESREDELQKIKYSEIIDLLIGAGYYRAKIKGLSEFDKVVGGMSWCIDVCKMDLDVDILFQENSTIGQKIALTEKIVAVLPKMKCPHSIEPHQIQGLDFINILPVMEWLVKQSNQNRSERGDYLRQYAVHQFDMHYCFPNEKPNQNFILRSLPNITAVQNKYRPHSRFKRVGSQTPSSDIYARVQSTLFEYGHAPIHKDEKSDDEKSETGDEVIDEDKVKQLSKNMMATTGDAQIASKAVSSIVGLKADEIVSAAESYFTLVSQSELGEENEKKRQKSKETALLREKAKIEAEIEEAKLKLSKLERKRNFREKKEAGLSDQEKSMVKDLETKLLLIDSLVERENQFKEKCKIERDQLEQMIREAEEEMDETREDNELDSMTREMESARMTLAKFTRAEAKLIRMIDQIPSGLSFPSTKGVSWNYTIRFQRRTERPNSSTLCTTA
uniref:Coiled-coil domain-containing protein 93 n=1 Tax=Lygus hesperus TaxID=30085 RepID=A0A0A9YIZ6_LYGHE